MRNKAAQGFRNVARRLIYPDWAAKLKIVGNTLQRKGG
jgi:hypothetical protein